MSSYLYWALAIASLGVISIIAIAVKGDYKEEPHTGQCSDPGQHLYV